MIPDVEGFGAELQLDGLSQIEVLQERKIPLVETGSDQDIPAARAETPRRRDGEGRGIEPPRERALSFREIGIADQICSRCGYANTSRVLRNRDGVWRSALIYRDAGEVSASQHRLHQPVRMLAEERQFVNVIDVQRVCAVDAGESGFHADVVNVLE